jgi:hypothetical protein
MKMLIVKVSVTWEMLQPNCFDNGMRNTLQAYTAPSAIWRNTPAIAMTQRLAGFMSAFAACSYKQILP